MAVTVNGVEISEAKIQEEIARLREEYEQYVQAEGGEPKEEQLREWAAENLIETQLFREVALATQPVPSEERVKQELDKNATLYETLPEEQRLAQASVTLQQRRMMKDIRKSAKLPSEGEMRDYYDAHPDLFIAPEALRLSHVCRYLDAGNKAQVYLDLLELKTALDNKAIAWGAALSANSDTFRRDYGRFATVAHGELPAAVEEKLWNLGEDEVSDVIDLGMETLHLFKVTARLETTKIKYHDIKDDLRKKMFEEACSDRVNARLDELKAAAVIERQ